MQQQDYQKVFEATAEFLKDPFHEIFHTMVFLNDASLPEYSKYVSKPIALEVIKANLESKKYSTPAEWYNDINRMYQNAIEYHYKSPVGTKEIGILATYLQWKFKKQYKNMLIKSDKEWLNKVIKKSNQITEIMQNMPISSRRSSNLSSYVKKMDSVTEPMKPIDVTPTVEKLNNSLSDVEFRQDIYQLLKETEGIVPGTIPNDTIDFEKLKPGTQNIIKDYVNRH
ncbi:Bromodomain containing protein [Trichomonas vaginalis G3]|uniref:Bromodomain containing protein n=1 Tax=Trichomonas vaginalis (strain ATCC PRA-98 / G3) TaxID=412133 RepID=A2FJ61_TRIV3|nr:bromodomain family [Trichomonas vaginalis G3]EAX95068.1 Bromodomain containing protein [Trichomonas vaginalis G3]KAI5484690.1 bromodomain family [Trichomonas vaginalis G3]|eukprot:XP_001307998.1 Bromodomain containing protein [Trichomonas vaginalis G3]